jgi:hypothetical protein
MPDNAYHFITTWRVEGTIEEVKRVLGDAAGRLHPKNRRKSPRRRSPLRQSR